MCVLFLIPRPGANEVGDSILTIRMIYILNISVILYTDNKSDLQYLGTQRGDDGVFCRQIMFCFGPCLCLNSPLWAVVMFPTPG